MAQGSSGPREGPQNPHRVSYGILRCRLHPANLPRTACVGMARHPVQPHLVIRSRQTLLGAETKHRPLTFQVTFKDLHLIIPCLIFALCVKGTKSTSKRIDATRPPKRMMTHRHPYMSRSLTLSASGTTGLMKFPEKFSSKSRCPRTPKISLSSTLVSRSVYTSQFLLCVLMRSQPSIVNLRFIGSCKDCGTMVLSLSSTRESADIALSTTMVTTSGSTCSRSAIASK